MKLNDILKIIQTLSQSNQTKIPEWNWDLKNDLCLDSLDIVDLMMKLEKKYNIEFDELELSPLLTLGDIVTQIKTLKETHEKV